MTPPFTEYAFDPRVMDFRYDALSSMPRCHSATDNAVILSRDFLTLRRPLCIIVHTVILSSDSLPFRKRRGILAPNLDDVLASTRPSHAGGAAFTLGGKIASPASGVWVRSPEAHLAMLHTLVLHVWLVVTSCRRWGVVVNSRVRVLW